jgi:hypothetical protein
MSLRAKVAAYFGTANMSGTERRVEANKAYARQLIEAERACWYAQLRSLVRAEQDAARRELDHLDQIERQGILAEDAT